VITDDDELLDDLLRLAAVSGTDVDVVPDVGAARGLWRSARVVLLGSDAALRTRTRPPRRRGVVLVGHDLDDGGVWELGVLVGAEHVAVLPDAEAWLLDVLTSGADRRLDPAPIIAVIGGRGGAGATTVAVALAMASVRVGRSTMLLDADPLGGGIDLALGGEGASGLRWDAFDTVSGRLASAELTGVLPSIDGLTVLTWERSAPGCASVPVPAIEAAVDAGRRGHDLVVADLPRALDLGAQSVADQAAVVFLVVPAELRAAAAAARVRYQLQGCADVRLVVRGPSPGGLDGWLIADALGLPLAADLRAEQGLAAAYERGEVPGTRPRSPLAQFADRTVEEFIAVGRRPAA
jgi:secretion/DNA translocation related CpaE-like protein